MKKRYIIGIDEGTTSARAGIYDTEKNTLVSLHAVLIKQIYPKAGWVSHDVEHLVSSQMEAIKKCLDETNISEEEIIGLGITNQRETALAFDRITGKPLAPAVVWQCRRTAKRCQNLTKQEKKMIWKKTGLIADAYFSATKMEWLLKNDKNVKKALKEKRLCLGTVDSYLAFRLTGRFVTDATNAARTMLFNIHTGEWDDELLKLFSVPKECLPEVISCDEEIGVADLFGRKVRVAGMIGDQQAALFGQTCFRKGMVKNTYGTGCFMMMNVGKNVENQPDKILTTIAYKLKDQTTYAFEGTIFNAGSIVTWFKEELGMIVRSRETGPIAESVPDSNGVYFVPAFTGLGAPYWDSDARAMFVGITRGTNKNHIIRAGLESMAYATMDILKEMEKFGGRIYEMRCDGGVTKNDFLMQYQADLAGRFLRLQETPESTLMGAVYMCGLALGRYRNLSEIEKCWKERRVFTPNKRPSIKKYYAIWKQAVNLSRKWKPDI